MAAIAPNTVNLRSNGQHLQSKKILNFRKTKQFVGRMSPLAHNRSMNTNDPWIIGLLHISNILNRNRLNIYQINAILYILNRNVLNIYQIYIIILNRNRLNIYQMYIIIQ